jgi:hypothetical protein
VATDKLLLDDVIGRLTEWRRSFRLWRALNNALRIISLVLSFSVAVGFRFLQTHGNVIQILAWLAFLSTLILLWLQPAKRGKAYADAWRMLDDAFSRYQVEENFPVEKVYDIRREGEKMISFTDPS